MSELTENQKRKKLEEAEAREAARSAVKEYLAEQEVFFVTKDGKYWKFVEDSQEWVFNTSDALRQSDWRIRSQLNWEQFLRIQQELGGVKETKTYSFKQTPASVLNMMRPQNWLKPKTGTPNVFFNYMITAVSGSKPENALHIKQLLGWKYLHPETWQLPSLAWYGKGGAGKNLFAEKMLPIIFGTNGVAKRGFRQVERFSESIAGKTVVFFDERPSRDDENTLKLYVGQPTLSIEGKGFAVYECENTAWYILATNGETGPVRIEKNGTERRWSIIKTVETLVDVVARFEGVDEAEARKMVVAADAEIFGNPDEVAVFLNECIEEAKKLEVFPHALHGEDYEELVQTQQSAEEDLFQDVFLDAGFEDVSLTALYQIYVERTKEQNPGASPLSIQNFSGRAMAFLMNNKLDTRIKRTVKRVNVKRGSASTGSKSPIFYNANIMSEPTVHQDKTLFYSSGAYLEQSKSRQKLAIVGKALTDNVLTMN